MLISFLLFGAIILKEQITKPDPCDHGVLITQEKVDGGTVEKRGCYEPGEEVR